MEWLIHPLQKAVVEGQQLTCVLERRQVWNCSKASWDIHCAGIETIFCFCVASGSRLATTHGLVHYEEDIKISLTCLPSFSNPQGYHHHRLDVIIPSTFFPFQVHFFVNNSFTPHVLLLISMADMEGSGTHFIYLARAELQHNKGATTVVWIVQESLGGLQRQTVPLGPVLSLHYLGVLALGEYKKTGIPLSCQCTHSTHLMICNAAEKQNLIIFVKDLSWLWLHVPSKILATVWRGLMTISAHVPVRQTPDLSWCGRNTMSSAVNWLYILLPFPALSAIFFPSASRIKEDNLALLE